MNELREEIELPPMDYGLAAHEQCDVREEQLKSSLAANRDLQTMLDVRTIEIKNAEEENDQLLAANREQKAEVLRLNKSLHQARSEWTEEKKRALESEAELASLRASVGEKWIDVKQELPPNSTAVLVWCPERKNTYTANWREAYWSHFGGYSRCHVEEEITHWKPLPVAPTLPGEEK